MVVRIFSVSDCTVSIYVFVLELQRVGEIAVAMTCAAGEAYGEKSWLIVDVR